MRRSAWLASSVPDSSDALHLHKALRRKPGVSLESRVVFATVFATRRYVKAGKMFFGTAHHRAVHSRRKARIWQAGLTLVELMISIVLGMLIVLAATSLLLTTKSGYMFQDESVRIQDTGRYALESLAHAIRQTAYENWDGRTAPIVMTESLSANINGLDAGGLKSKSDGIDNASTESVNGSDVLALRFFGAGEGEHGDGAVNNCAGFGVPAATSPAAAESERGWSIFHVASDSSGEPELHCKYRGSSGWTSQAVARGVESFQVVYGVDLDEDGLPDRFMNATSIDALDGSQPGADADAMQVAGRNRTTYWKKVVMVRVAMLIRGSGRQQAGNAPTEYDLFGKDYADAFGSTDPGVRIRTASLPKAVRDRVRKIFSMTILLRNHAAGSSL